MMEFRDLKKQYKVLKEKIDEKILSVCEAGDYILGKPVLELEKELAEYVGTKHCITCANGTDALKMVLMGWNVGANDAVFVPSFTFFATAEVVADLGATPIFVDVEESTFNMDYISLEKKIIETMNNSNLALKAIITVDLFGLPANYDMIEKIAKKYNMLILEDGAQGFGGSINGKMACSFGDAATTSFFPSKPIGCYGDGGAIFTNDDNLTEYLKSIRAHGKGNEKYDNIRIGLNSRLDTVQAAVLLVKLEAFKGYELGDINKVANLYTSLLKDIVIVPTIPSGYISSFAQYTIVFDSEELRNKVQLFLKNNGIPTAIYYPRPLHLQKAFSYLGNREGYTPISEKLCKTVLSLPMHPYLSENDVELIVNLLKRGINLSTED